MDEGLRLVDWLVVLLNYLGWWNPLFLEWERIVRVVSEAVGYVPIHWF